MCQHVADDEEFLGTERIERMSRGGGGTVEAHQDAAEGRRQERLVGTEDPRHEATDQPERFAKKRHFGSAAEIGIAAKTDPLCPAVACCEG